MEKMKIVFWPADNAGCGYYRCVIPARSISRLGLADAVSVEFNENNIPNSHVLVLQRNVSLSRLKLAQKQRDEMGTLIVSEEDDNFRALPEENPAWSEFHPKIWKSHAAHIFNTRFTGEWQDLSDWGQKQGAVKLLREYADDCSSIEEVWERVPRNNFHENHLASMGFGDIATVTTEHLYNVYSKINPNCYILPNCIDFEEPAFKTAKTLHDGIIIGWAGSLTHIKDLKIVQSAIIQLMNEFPETRLMIGAEFQAFKTVFNTLPNMDKFIKKCEDIFGEKNTRAKSIEDTIVGGEVVSDCGRYIYRRGVNVDKYPEMFRDLDIGLVPLVLRSFNDGKSDLKGLELAAMKVPIVASPTQEYVSWRTPGTGCFLPRLNRYRYWYSFIKKMIVDKGLRDEMSEQAYGYSKLRDIDRWAQAWVNAYSEGIEKSGRMEIKYA